MLGSDVLFLSFFEFYILKFWLFKTGIVTFSSHFLKNLFKFCGGKKKSIGSKCLNIKSNMCNLQIYCFSILPGSAILFGADFCTGTAGRSSSTSTKLRGKIPTWPFTSPRAHSSPTYSFSRITSPSEKESSSLFSPSKSNLATHLGPLKKMQGYQILVIVM